MVAMPTGFAQKRRGQRGLHALRLRIDSLVIGVIVMRAKQGAQTVYEIEQHKNPPSRHAINSHAI
jgi:hypothetical protein